MNKVKCIWNDIVNNFFSKRLLVFCIFQFSILHYYISTVKHFSIMADYPATPWILPFIGQNVYCLFVYGISVVYFYSNIPFMQKHEMYVLMRQGRNRWVFTKTLRICLSAVMLSIIEFALSVLILLPRVELTAKWGKLYNSLAMTSAGTGYGVKLFFSYEIINENSAIRTLLIFWTVLFVVTALIGMLMFVLSIYINRTAAVVAGTFFSVLPVVFANLYLYKEWIGFISPLSWLNLLLLYGKICKKSPSFLQIIIVTAILIPILSVVSLKGMQSKDLSWINEE